MNSIFYEQFDLYSGQFIIIFTEYSIIQVIIWVVEECDPLHVPLADYCFSGVTAEVLVKLKRDRPVALFILAQTFGDDH